jgi:beta-N-acetylhexosaminidase
MTKNTLHFTLHIGAMSVLFITLACCFIGCADNKKTGTAEAAKWAEKTLAGLTLEKKVAQLICTDISGSYIPDDDPRMESWTRLAGKYGIGGFVLYGGTPQNVVHLLNRLQKEADLPLLISSDFEGGPGQQVSGASEFPANMAFAAARDGKLMYEAAKIMAEEGRGMGIHLTYTPVTDVSVLPDNPQESTRSFGGDIDLIGRMLKAYVKGCKEMGMLTTSKHFPGRGDMKAFADHPGFNYLDKTAGEIEQNEFRAFKYAVDAGVDFIMTEHIAVPSVTGGSKLPASVEPKLVKGVIREKLGFTGIITTDDLWYDHVTARFGQEEVAVKALEAGHDILLKPKDPIAIIRAVVEAVKHGRISEDQINHSVYKLLYQKAMLGLHRNRLVDEDRIGQVIGTTAHRAKIQEVADRSVTLLRNEGVFPLKNWDPRRTVHITIQKEEYQPSVRELIQKMTSSFQGITSYSLKPDMSESYYNSVKKASAQAELVLLSFFVQRDRFGDPAPVNERDLELIRQILSSGHGKVIAMSYGNPHIIKRINTVQAFIAGYGEGGWYGNQQVYFDSFIKIMKGELTPSGKLPLMISRDYPVGFGLTY